MATCYCWTSGPLCCRNQRYAIPWLLPVAAYNHFAVPGFEWNAAAAEPLTVDNRYVENKGVHP